LVRSSSDSDSDPEGGELPEIGFSKDKPIQKKKIKKKRSDKAVEERNKKLAHKRQVYIFNENFFIFSTNIIFKKSTYSHLG
jgi:hypothetical protein